MSEYILEPQQYDLLKLKPLLKQGIDYVGIINKQGRLWDAIYTRDITISDEKKEMLFMEISLISSMTSNFDEDLGTVRYNLTERGKLKLISIPIQIGTVFVITKIESDHNSLVKKLIKFFKKFEENQ